MRVFPPINAKQALSSNERQQQKIGAVHKWRLKFSLTYNTLFSIFLNYCKKFCFWSWRTLIKEVTPSKPQKVSNTYESSFQIWLLQENTRNSIKLNKSFLSYQLNSPAIWQHFSALKISFLISIFTCLPCWCLPSVYKALLVVCKTFCGYFQISCTYHDFDTYLSHQFWMPPWKMVTSFMDDSIAQWVCSINDIAWARPSEASQSITQRPIPEILFSLEKKI